MVKNIPTIERSTKIRFGKHATDDQAENTIVFNASNVAIDASSAGGVYVTPMRTVDPSTPEITVLSYNTVTKEIVNSNTASADLFNSNLHFVSQRGNVTSNTLQFTNPTTAFITTGGVGIGSSVSIDPNADNKIQVSGTIKTGTLHADNIGISNTSPTHALSLGNEGQLRLNVPTGSIYALETVGNVSAQNYIGDGGLLSNVTLQTVTDKSNITSNTLQLTNPTTSLKAYSNIIVDGKITVGTPIETTSGGTGHDTYIPGTILYGTDTGTSLGRLVPAGSNQDAGKFLRLDGSDTPEWAEVPLTLDAVLGDTTAVSDGSMNLTGTDTTITTAGKIKAVMFEGLGSELDGINAANVAPLTGTFTTSVLPIVPVTKGGTGLNSVSTGDILYASGTDQIANLAKGTANKVLQMDSAANLPEWTSTITGATLNNPTLTSYITHQGDSNTQFGFPGNDKFIIKTTGSERLRINDLGNIGIGKSSPSSKLDVNGTVTASTFKSTSLTSGKIPYVNNDNEIIDGPIGHDSTTNNTFVSSNLYVTGNLTVQGTTTFQDSNIHTVSDPIIEIGNANAIDTIDMGVIMTRPTANVVAGYMGDEKKYVIAYTHSDPDGAHIVPTNATSDQFMTLSVEGGNVLAGNVTTTGKMTAGTLHGDSITVSGAVTGSTLVGDGSAITSLNPANLSSQVLLAKGGTGLTSVAQNELLLGPASGTALAKLSAYTGPTSITAPPSGMSSTTQTIGGIQYTSSASTTGSGTATNNAFDHDNATIWRSADEPGESYDSMDGYYSGSNTTGSYSGAWIQLYRATAIAPISIQIIASQTTSIPAPSAWKVFGSTNGSSWTEIHSSSTAVTWNSGNGHTATISGSAAYNYLRLAVQYSTMASSMGTIAVSEVRFSAQGTGPSEKFLKSSAAGIVWDEVSSTLQTITDGGATTTQTVAFNNTTTGLTSAGDIDIAATKQIDYAGDVLLKSSAGAVASLKVDNAIKLDPASGAAIVPPSGMSSTTQTIGGIQYTSSASSTMSGLATNNAFDHNNATIWRTALLGDYGSSNGTYYGADTTGSYSGEWIQLYRATAIAPTSIQIIPAQTTFAGPSVWKVFGSTNGSSWTEIHSSTTIVPWNSGNGSTETITGSAAYNYLRLAINKSAVPNSLGTVAVSEVRFTGPPPPSNNVLSFNTTTGEIYDSGGQGGSSLDNIHEEGANVAIGPSAASANLTVNTYGSNVLTVSGNVSADIITIGSLNVAASPFALDDVVSVNAGANVTANVLTLGGLVTSGNVDASNIIVSGNTTSQNIKLTNTDISATISSGTITIDAREKSYGTAPLVVSTTDVSNLVFSNLITGAQIVVPILASGGDIKISKELTNVNFYAMTTDVSVTQDKHALMTLSNLYGNIYMNAIGFA